MDAVDAALTGEGTETRASGAATTRIPSATPTEPAAIKLAFT